MERSEYEESHHPFVVPLKRVRGGFMRGEEEKGQVFFS
jgi:hypothetical protein